MAIFVEGHTEFFLIRRLMKYLTPSEDLQISRYDVTGERCKRRFRDAKQSFYYDDGTYCVQLVVCSAGEHVISDIRERYSELTSNGFTTILAVRDAYPEFKYDDIPNRISSWQKEYRYLTIQPFIVIATMETEAWFIAEHSHFQRIDSKLTIEKIKSILQFDPRVENVEMRKHPASDLKKIYKSVEVNYNKYEAMVKQDVNCLNLETLCADTTNRAHSLKRLIHAIELFFEKDISESPSV